MQYQNQTKITHEMLLDQLRLEHLPFSTTLTAISFTLQKNWVGEKYATFSFELRSLVSFLCSAPSIQVCDFFLFKLTGAMKKWQPHKMTALRKCDNTKIERMASLHAPCACVGALVNMSTALVHELVTLEHPLAAVTHTSRQYPSSIR